MIALRRFPVRVRLKRDITKPNWFRLKPTPPETQAASGFSRTETQGRPASAGPRLKRRPASARTETQVASGFSRTESQVASGFSRTNEKDLVASGFSRTTSDAEDLSALQVTHDELPVRIERGRAERGPANSSSRKARRRSRRSAVWAT